MPLVMPAWRTRCFHDSGSLMQLCLLRGGAAIVVACSRTYVLPGYESPPRFGCIFYTFFYITSVLKPSFFVLGRHGCLRHALLCSVWWRAVYTQVLEFIFLSLSVNEERGEFATCVSTCMSSYLSLWFASECLGLRIQASPNGTCVCLCYVIPLK